MSERGLIVRGMLINYLHLLAAFLVMFVLTPIIVGRLGTTAYGIWAIFSSVGGYFAICDFGMNTAVAKYTAEYRAKAQLNLLTKLVSTTFAASLAIGAFIVGACVVMTPFVPRLFNIPGNLTAEGNAAFVLMGTNVALMLLGGVYGNIIYGHQRVDVWKSFSIIQILANAAFTVLFLRLGFGLLGVAGASVLSTLILLSLYVAFICRSGYGISVDLRMVDAEVFKLTAPYSLRTFLLGVTNRIVNYSDLIVIGLFMGAGSVAQYEITYKLCFLSTYLFSVISATMFPRFSRLFALEDVEALGELFLVTAKVSIAVMMPVSIFLFFWGGEFIGLWVGPKAFVGMRVLPAFVAMTFLHSVGTPAVALLQAIGKNDEFVYSEIANACLNLGLSILLIKSLGLLGVALGTLLASVCTSGWVVPILACKYARISVWTYLRRAILPPTLVGIAVFGAMAVFRSHHQSPNGMIELMLIAGFLATLYGVLYLACAATSSERELARQLLKHLING